jgi:hypothetical protein
MSDKPFIEDLIQPKPYIEDMVLPRSTVEAPSLAGAQFDQYFGDQVSQGQNPGKILHQFGQGFRQGWGTKALGVDSETEKHLKDAGIFNDYTKGQNSLVREFNEAIIRPLVLGVDLAMRIPYSISRGLAETSSPLALLGAAGTVIQEAPLGIIPHMPAPIRITPRMLARAHDLGITDERGAGITPNEAQRRPGPERPEPLTDHPVADATPSAEPVQPDIHALAREASPIAMERYDDLGERQQVLHEQLGAQEQARAQDPRAVRAQEEINTILEKVNGVEARLTKRAATRLGEIREDLQTFLGTDTEEMALTRRELAKADEARRDLAPEVTKAYQLARERMPPEEAPPIVVEPEPASAEVIPFPETTLAESEVITGKELRDKYTKTATEDSAFVKKGSSYDDVTGAAKELSDKARETLSNGGQVILHIEGKPREIVGVRNTSLLDKDGNPWGGAAIYTSPRDSIEFIPKQSVSINTLAQRRPTIAQTVSAQLREAGRPAEEANAAGALAQAHYQARAARFEGALGTARELFDREAPTVVGAAGRQRGQIDLPTNTIRLFENADASTFVHESAHAWLEEMLRDAEHPAAPEELKQDLAALKDWLGAEGGRPSRAEHEKFARGFERYLMEGTAPTERLAGVFAKFKQWLTSIYQTVSRLRAPINDEIRAIYDRLISNPREETIIAPEREVGRDFADVHEADVASATDENALARANEIRAERDEIAQILTPEINNARRRIREEGPAAGRGTGEAGGEGDAVLSPDAARGGPESTGEETGGRPIAISPSGAKFKAESEPPASGHEPFGATERLVGDDGRPVLDRIESPDDIDSAIRIAAERSGRRGEATPGQLIDLSDATGIDASMFPRGVADAGQIEALSRLAIDAATDVHNKMVQVAEGGDPLELAVAIARLEMIQGKAVQAAHEWGRAGVALRAFKEATGSNAIDALNSLLKEHSGRSYDQLMQLARMHGALDTPSKVGAAVHQSHNAFTRGVVFTVMNGFLSNPFTHAVYFVGNKLRNVLHVAETGIAGGIGEVRSLLGLGAEDRVYMREAGATINGLMTGFERGLVPAIESFRAGQQQPLPGQKGFTNPWGGAYASPFPEWGSYVGGPIGSAIYGTGQVISVPGRSVAAVHQFGRVIFYEQYLQRYATRQAIEEGLEGTDLAARIHRLTSDPPKELMRAAADEADTAMFQRRGGFNSITRAIEGWTEKYAIAKILFPFVKIGMEITREQFVKRTPLGLASHEVRGDLLGRRGGAAFDDAAAKQMLGLGMLATGVGWAMSGNITGPGPSDPKARSEWLLTHKPYSIAVGNLWVPYRGLGPQANLLEFGVDLWETQAHWDGKDGEKLAGAYMKAVAHSVLTESFFRSMATLTNVFADPGRNAPGFLENLGSAAVPFSSAVGSVNRYFLDPYQKDIEPGFRGFVDALRSRIPVASWSVPNRVDMFGNDVMARGTVLNPMSLRNPYANDPTAAWLDHLGTGPGRIDRTIAGVRLTEPQFIDLSRTAGRFGKELLDSARPMLQSLPKGVQIKEIDRILNIARGTARKQVMMQSLGTSNDIVAKATEEKLKGLE